MKKLIAMASLSCALCLCLLACTGDGPMGDAAAIEASTLHPANGTVRFHLKDEVVRAADDNAYSIFATATVYASGTEVPCEPANGQDTDGGKIQGNWVEIDEVGNVKYLRSSDRIRVAINDQVMRDCRVAQAVSTLIRVHFTIHPVPFGSSSEGLNGFDFSIPAGTP